ncbi:hypothetical protein IFR05_010782 [Cadophora sp. M221]|nr:hypothetical protein IFR05_010782 [Cadophora sp. M221]
MIKTAHSNGSSSTATSKLSTEKSRAGKDCWKFRIFTACPMKTPTSSRSIDLMLYQFLAIVVIEQDVNSEVMGILMPFGGPSLESLSVSGPNSTASTSSSKDLEITRGQLRDLARSVRELV